MKATSNWLEFHTRFRPDAEAVYDADNGRRWSYAALQHESLQWAAFLDRHGVRAGDRVAVLSHSRGEMFALLFACAEVGAILFPMNWRLSPVELQWQLDNADPSLVLVDAEHAAVLAVDVKRIEDGPGETTLSGPGSALDDPWMLMYTSGSSGKPKGALLTHRQVHWNAVNTIFACDLTSSDSTLTFTPLFHTGGMNCLSTPLLYRGGRVILTRMVRPGQAIDLIESEGITLLMGVPTIYQLMADHERFAGADLSTVRDALCGGAPLSVPLLERYLGRDIPLRQGFGMTEVGPNCFSMPHDAVKSKLESVGLPIPHVGMKLMRPDGTECDVGEPGELWLSGPAVFGGYWRNPEANAKSFVDGWFRTGDVLSCDEDGFFRVSGRIKEMFISGGENVYPAEVEAAIFQCPGVANTAVVGVPDDRWGEVGRAFVEPRPGHAVTERVVKAFLEGKLARYKRPKRVIVLDQLPRTASGKIDKQTLKATAAQAE